MFITPRVKINTFILRKIRRSPISGFPAVFHIKSSGYSQSASLLAHNQITAPKFISRSLHSSWYKQVPTHCLFLFAIEAGDLLDLVKKEMSGSAGYRKCRQEMVSNAVVHFLLYMWKVCKACVECFI